MRTAKRNEEAPSKQTSVLALRQPDVTRSPSKLSLEEIQQRIASRFRGGAVAQRAAYEVLSQRQPLTSQQDDGMFVQSNQAPAPGSQDLLDAAAYSHQDEQAATAGRGESLVPIHSSSVQGLDPAAKQAPSQQSTPPSPPASFTQPLAGSDTAAARGLLQPQAALEDDSYPYRRRSLQPTQDPYMPASSVGSVQDHAYSSTAATSSPRPHGQSVLHEQAPSRGPGGQAQEAAYSPRQMHSHQQELLSHGPRPAAPHHSYELNSSQESFHALLPAQRSMSPAALLRRSQLEGEQLEDIDVDAYLQTTAGPAGEPAAAPASPRHAATPTPASPTVRFNVGLPSPRGTTPGASPRGAAGGASPRANMSASPHGVKMGADPRGGMSGASPRGGNSSATTRSLPRQTKPATVSPRTPAYQTGKTAIAPRAATAPNTPRTPAVADRPASTTPTAGAARPGSAARTPGTRQTPLAQRARTASARRVLMNEASASPRGPATRPASAGRVMQGNAGSPVRAATAGRPASAARRVPAAQAPQAAGTRGTQLLSPAGWGAAAPGRAASSPSRVLQRPISAPLSASPRGVGAGQYGRGTGQVEEAMAVMDALRSQGATPTGEEIPRSESPAPESYHPRSFSPTVHGTARASGWTDAGFVSSSLGKSRQPKEFSDAYFERYKVKKHRDPALVEATRLAPAPDYKFSQPSSKGPQVTLKQVMWSFDDAHPAIAGEHWMRTRDQNELLEKERRAAGRRSILLQAQKLRHAQQRRVEALLKRVRGPMASAEAAQRTGGASRQASDLILREGNSLQQEGYEILKALQEEGERLNLRSQQVAARARDAIAASERLSTRQQATQPALSRELHSTARDDLASNATATQQLPSRQPSQQSQRMRNDGGARPASALAASRREEDEESEGDDWDGLEYDSDDASALSMAAAERRSMIAGLEDRLGRLQSSIDEIASAGSVSPGAAPPKSAVEMAREAAAVNSLLDAIDDMENPGPAAQGGHVAGSSLADHLAAAQNKAAQEDELATATGAYSPRRFDDYQQQLDTEMARRYDEGVAAGQMEDGYNSDVEREAAALAAARREAGVQQQTDAEAFMAEAEQLQAAWDEENSWMDRYRTKAGYQRMAPPEPSQQQGAEDSEEEEGGEPEAPIRRTHSPTAPSKQQPANVLAATNGSGFQISAFRPEGAERQRRSAPATDAAQQQAYREKLEVLTRLQRDRLDDELLQQPYVPIVSNDPLVRMSLRSAPQSPRRSASPRGYSSDGPSLPSLRPRARPRFHKTTVPQPFTFEERAKQRAKPIMTVKLEQDLELRRLEEEAAAKRRFRAKPVPAATLEPRYEAILADQEFRRQLNHEQSVEVLRSMEQPFSFYYREQERKTQQEGRTGRDPNRFQIKFQAKPIPGHVHEERFRMMMAEAEARKAAAQARMHAAQTQAKIRVMTENERRREEAAGAYKQRMDALRHVDPILHQRYETYPLGTVPDFDRLHAEWEQRQAQLRARNRRRVTVPQEFRVNGLTPEEEARRRAKSEERKRRIVMEMMLDDQQLRETRWPFMQPRGKVRPTPPPAFEPPELAPYDTVANKLRTLATKRAMSAGRYAGREAQEARALERAKRDAQRRAAHWTELQAKFARERGMDVGTTDLRTGGDQQASGRAGQGWREDTPAMHIEARHRQAEAAAREIVEEELLKNGGLDAYRYVEGV